jgi:hypothetical protein
VNTFFDVQIVTLTECAHNQKSRSYNHFFSAPMASAVLASPINAGPMNVQEWPSLNSSPPPELHDWEMIPSEDSNAEFRGFFPQSSCSAPDLQSLVISEETMDGDDDFSTFSKVSGVGSVWSAASGVSFKDVVSKSSGTAVVVDQSSQESVHITRQQQRRIKPRFVVKPIKRCTKSTGDLNSLYEEEEAMFGSSDAQEFYSRKLAGAQGRTNGLKLRPDEAKRKEIVMNKKDEQRQVNAQCGKKK